MPGLTQERLHTLFTYNTLEGHLYTKHRQGAIAGEKAGWSNPNHYISIMVDRKVYLEHRLVWLFVYGTFPEKHIDHIDQNKHNNRLENLREVTQQTNSKNCSISKNNKSGMLGVSWHKQANKWRAYIMVDKKHIHLGLFTDKDKAISTRKQAEITYDFHPNHGKMK